MTKLQFFNMIVYQIFSVKMFKLKHQFNNIVKISQTTQLTNDQMPEFHCHCKSLKCPPLGPSSNTSHQSLNLKSFL